MDCQISSFRASVDSVADCAEELQDYVKRKLACFGRDSSFELVEIFCLPPAAIHLLFECSPEVLDGAEGGHGWWVVVFGDEADSLVLEVLLSRIGVMGRCKIGPKVVPTIAVHFPNEWNHPRAEDLDVDPMIHGVASSDEKQLRNSPWAHREVDEELPLELFLLHVSGIVGTGFDIPRPDCVVSSNAVILETEVGFVVENDMVASIDGEVMVGQCLASFLDARLLFLCHLRNLLPLFVFASLKAVHIQLHNL